MDFRRLPERGGRPDRRSRDHHAGLCRTTLRQSDYSGWGQSETIDAVYVPGPTEPPIPAPDRTFGQGTWLRWQLALTDKFSLARERRTYFHIPASGYGTRNVDYARTLLGYDDAGRQNQTTDPDDTIDKTTFNAVGWPVAQAVATLTTTGPSALTTVRSDEFDDSGNLTRTTLPVDANTGDDRVTDFGYDWRNRPERQTTTVEKDDGTPTPAVRHHHPVWACGPSSASAPMTTSTRWSRRPITTPVTTAPVPRPTGPVTGPPPMTRWAGSGKRRSMRWTPAVLPATRRSRAPGTPPPAGSPAARHPAANSSPPPLRRRGAGRQILRRLLPVRQFPSNPADVSNAVVMEQREMAWDQAGNLTATITRQRLDTVPDTTLGELTASTSRTTYAASYPDAVGRIFATADYGTNGSTNGSGGWTRLSTVPPRSDDVLVSSTRLRHGRQSRHANGPRLGHHRQHLRRGRPAHRAGGELVGSQRHDPHDPLPIHRRRSAGEALSDNPDTGTQITEWVYGVTTGQGSALNSNRLLREKIYPGGGADRETYTYNRQGQPITMTDPNGTVHAYTYDKLGVRLADTVTTFGTGVDSTVGRLEAGYNERRLQVRATSANASGSVVLNEVAWGYNDFNQPVTEWQEHGGRVNAGSPKVQYTYADGSANTIRPTGITYPDGTTTIATDYNSAQASALSRPDRISGSGGVIASWQYLGLGAVVGRKFDAASGVESTLGTAAAGYPGIDRFGRLVETRWQNGTTDLVHTQYGRNRAGGVVWQRNALAHGLTPAVATEDSYYWYDGLRQVTRHDRGDLTGSPYSGVVAATRQQKETFTFDQTGNWTNTTSESPWLDQSRTHNVANEITAIGSPYGVVQPQFDAAGNMTVMPRPGAWDASLACTWDAWNRLVRVRSCSGSSSSSGFEFLGFPLVRVVIFGILFVRIQFIRIEFLRFIIEHIGIELVGIVVEFRFLLRGRDLSIRRADPARGDGRRRRDPPLLLQQPVARRRGTRVRRGHGAVCLEPGRPLGPHPPQALGHGHARRDPLRAAGLPRSRRHHQPGRRRHRALPLRRVRAGRRARARLQRPRHQRVRLELPLSRRVHRRPDRPLQLRIPVLSPQPRKVDLTGSHRGRWGIEFVWFCGE